MPAEREIPQQPTLSPEEARIRKFAEPTPATVDGMLRIAISSSKELTGQYERYRPELIAYANALRAAGGYETPSTRPIEVLREIRKAHTLKEYRELKPLFKIVRRTFRIPTPGPSYGWRKHVRGQSRAFGR